MNYIINGFDSGKILNAYLKFTSWEKNINKWSEENVKLSAVSNKPLLG